MLRLHNRGFLMKHLSILLLIILLLDSSSFAQNESQTDSIPKFRGFEWGVSMDEVRSIELSRYMQTFIGFGVNIITYSGEISDYKAEIDYVFEDSILVEASYCIKVEIFPDDFKKIMEYYISKFGTPFYWANSHPNSVINWRVKSENDLCRGPELYWEYCNGFMGLIAEKYKDEITISILYVYQKTIHEYGKYVIFPYSEIVEK